MGHSTNSNAPRIAAMVVAAAALLAGGLPAVAHEAAAGRPTAVAATTMPQEAAHPLDPRLAHLPRVSELPPGTVRVSPHVPGMGEHWANPRDLPLGPIYCVMDGRVTCMEFMIAQQDLREGRSFERLRPWPAGGVPQPAVDHVNFDFMPRGHEGYEVPHYDVHMYFVPADLLEQDRRARQAAR